MQCRGGISINWYFATETRGYYTEAGSRRNQRVLPETEENDHILTVHALLDLNMLGGNFIKIHLVFKHMSGDLTFIVSLVTLVRALQL